MPRTDVISDYVTLMKPRVLVLVLLVTGVGYFMGLDGTPDVVVLIACLLGTGLLGASASVLNQVLERGLDARMDRTKARPLAAGRLCPRAGARFGIALGVVGEGLLAGFAGSMAALLGAITILSYVLVYTPLKRRSTASLLVGAVPGAMPPLIGWVAASAELSAGAWSVFALLFVWQLPHFAAIGWLYRADYRRAGFRVLGANDDVGRLTAIQMISNTVLLIAVSMAPRALGIVGGVYFGGALVAGLAFLASTCFFARVRDPRSARVVIHASLAYLPILFVLMIADKA